MSRSLTRSVVDSGAVDSRLDVSLDVLANSYRRAALSRLVEADDDVAFDRLVDQVIDAVDDQAVETPTTDRTWVATRLYHVHLPKLADAGVLAHDDWESFKATDRGEAAIGLLEGVEPQR